MVSVAQGPPIEGGQSVWICMTNNSLIDDGFTAGEPRVCADLSLQSVFQSDRNSTGSHVEKQYRLLRTLMTVMVSLSQQRGYCHLYKGLRGHVEDNSTDYSDMPL